MILVFLLLALLLPPACVDTKGDTPGVDQNHPAEIDTRCDMPTDEQSPAVQKVRKAVFAGSWYEGTEPALTNQIDRFLDGAKMAAVDKPVRALISPHAGLVYSGATAAVGFKTLDAERVKRVMLLALSHRHPFKGASILDVTHYETPLGLIPVDRAACDEIVGDEHFSCVPGAHRSEHSLEIQLPFLQRVLGEGFSIIPLLVSHVDADALGAMADVLLPYWNDETVVVVSSDFTHYGEGYGYVPFDREIPENISKLDHGAVDRIVALDAEGFRRYVADTGATICGRNPIALLLTMARKKGYGARELFYTTSGEKTGDYSMSCSYLSIAVTGDLGGETKKPMPAELTDAEQATLLELARRSIESQIETGAAPKDLSGFAITPGLEEDLGAFVTLKIDGRLRGCIGYLTGRGPLYKTVIQNAINAAIHDPRFPEVRIEEIPRIDIEISVLSPVVEVDDPEEIKVGRDGLIVSRGFNRGTLLPQVAPEYGWSRIEFLEHTCAKAGLPKDAWKDEKTKIERYAAQVFGELEGRGGELEGRGGEKDR